MKTFHKIVVVLYTIALMILSGIFAYANLVSYDFLQQILNESLVTISANSILFFVIGVLLAILPVVTFVFSFTSSREQKQIVRHTDLGELKISTETVRGIALASIKEIPTIRDIELNVNIVKDEIVVTVKGRVANDVVIPELTVKLQSEIKDSVEKCTGVPVKEVKVVVGSSLQTSQVREVQ